MSTKTLSCLTCGSFRLRPHCQDQNGNRQQPCDLVVCRKCEAFGIPDPTLTNRWRAKR